MYSRVFLFIVGLLAVPTLSHAQTIEVVEKSAPVTLGGKVMGHVPEGARLSVIRESGGHYLVEVLVNGRFRSMVWVDSALVEVTDENAEPATPGSTSKRQLVHAYRDKDAKGKTLTSYKMADIRENTTHSAEPYDLLEKSKVIKVSELPPDPNSTWEHQRTERRYMAPDEKTDATSISATSHADDIDLSVARAPKEKPKNPLVSDKPIPYQEERTEQTLGRGTKKFGVGTENLITVGILFVVMLVMVGVAFKIAGDHEKKKRQRILAKAASRTLEK